MSFHIQILSRYLLTNLTQTSTTNTDNSDNRFGPLDKNALFCFYSLKYFFNSNEFILNPSTTCVPFA